MVAENLLKVASLPYRIFPHLRGSGLMHRWVGMKVRRNVESKMLRGFTMSLNPRNSLEWQLLLRGYWEEKMTRILEELLRPGDVFYDIGANVGYYTLMGSQIVGPSGRVVAFEPLSNNIRNLENNVGLNHFNNVTLLSVGLSDRKEDHEMHFPFQQYGLASMLLRHDATCSEKAVFITGDEAVENHRLPKPRILKIDVEGAEFKAIKGLERTLSSDSSMKMLIEITPFFLESLGSSEGALRSLLKSLGFRQSAVITRDVYRSKGVSIFQTNELFEKN